MKVLFIRYKKSVGVFEGGERGTEEKYQTICDVVGKENVDTYYIHDENKKKNILDYLRGAWYFPSHYYFGLTPRRVREIVALAHQYEVVWIDRSIFGIIARELKLSGYTGKVIVFFHNIEPTYFDAKLKTSMPLRNIIIRCAESNDKYSCHYADTIVSLTSRDSGDLKQMYGRSADFIAPIVLRDIYTSKPDPEVLTANPPLCTILAAYFGPNNDGIRWFVENVYNQVTIKLRIVGKGMGRLRNEPWMPDSVEICSDVPDLAPYLEAADIMILPIFKGSGMKVKTCESLMYGKNILATDEALVGYDVDEKLIGGRCNTPQEFIDCINDFCHSPRPRHNAHSRQTFLDHYSKEALICQFRAVLAN